ncbi:MAG TPA: ABC transporter substrate-binding protein [Stellaceae bacterium]|nr:ABC transporter substrate-binding protein [Stellaceae bacterium]
MHRALTVGVIGVAAVIGLLGGPAYADSPVIKIGVAQPLTGVNGDYFKRMTVNPVLMAVEEVNAKGGIDGRKVEVVVEDHKGNAATALAVARKLIDVDHVSMISISVSPAVLATLPVAEESHVLVMSVAQHPRIAASPWAAGCSPPAPLYGVVAARWGYQTMGARTAATLSENNDAMRLMIQAFKKEFTSLGGKVVDEELYNSEDQTYTAQLTNIRAANPDLLDVQSVGAQAYGLALKEAAELNFHPKTFIGGDQAADPQVRQIAGNLATGIYYTALDFNQKWNATKFKPRWGYDADSFAARTYDCTNIYFEALRRAHSLDPVKVRDTLYHIKNFHGVLGTWGYNGSGAPEMYPVVKRAE